MSILWWGNHFHTYIYFFYYYFSGWQKSIYGAKYTFLKGYIISIIQPLENILPYRKLRYCDSKKKKKFFTDIYTFYDPRNPKHICLYVCRCLYDYTRSQKQTIWLIFGTYFSNKLMYSFDRVPYNFEKQYSNWEVICKIGVGAAIQILPLWFCLFV